MSLNRPTLPPSENYLDVDSLIAGAWAGEDPERRLGIDLWLLRVSPSAEQFERACAGAAVLLRAYEPRGLLGWPRDRRHALIAAHTLRWWVYAACPSCRGQACAVALTLAASLECPTCSGTGRRRMDERALGSGINAARWLAERLDAAIGAVAVAVGEVSSPGETRPAE